MENYLMAARECFVIGLPLNVGERITVIRNSIHGQATYETNGRECECREMERTGVACPHLIMMAVRE